MRQPIWVNRWNTDKHREIEQMYELCQRFFTTNIYCPWGETINLLHTSEILGTKHNDGITNLDHQRYCYRRLYCSKAVFVDNDVMLVRTTTMGVLDCCPGEHHLNNGAECYFDSAFCYISLFLLFKLTDVYWTISSNVYCSWRQTVAYYGLIDLKYSF